MLHVGSVQSLSMNMFASMHRSAEGGGAVLVEHGGLSCPPSLHDYQETPVLLGKQKPQQLRPDDSCCWLPANFSELGRCAGAGLGPSELVEGPLLPATPGQQALRIYEF